MQGLRATWGVEWGNANRQIIFLLPLIPSPVDFLEIVSDTPLLSRLALSFAMVLKRMQAVATVFHPSEGGSSFGTIVARYSRGDGRSFTQYKVRCEGLLESVKMGCEDMHRRTDWSPKFMEKLTWIVSHNLSHIFHV